MLWVCLLCVIMALPGHSHLLIVLGPLFYGVVINVLPSLAINLLRKNKLVVLLSKYLVAV